MRPVLLLVFLAAAASSSPPPPLPVTPLRPPSPPPAAINRRLGFSSDGGGNMFQKLANWLFPETESRQHHSHGPPSGPSYGPPARHLPAPRPFHGPPTRPKHGGPPPPHNAGPPSPHHAGPPPPAQCNPCNKVPWVPIPHANNVLAVVNAPQLHQGLHGGPQPSAPVHHYSPVPQGFLHNGKEQEFGNTASASGTGVGSAPEIIPSIPVASFVSSVEYPVNVVQSPIIDINVAAGSSAPDSTGTGGSAPDNNNSYGPVKTAKAVSHVDETPPAAPEVISTGVSGLGGVGVNTEGVSYQNINLHAEHSVKQETLHPDPPVEPPRTHEITNTLSQEFQPPAPIPTQQQPPLNIPPALFQIPVVQQPPIPPLFHPLPVHQPPPSVHQPPPPVHQPLPPVHQPPPPVHQPPPPVFFHVPTYQQQLPYEQPPPPFQPDPPRFFTPASQINHQLRDPTAPDLSPPPLPGNPQHPYRFESVISSTPVPVVPEPTQQGNVHVHDQTVNKRPKQIQIIVPYTVSSNSLLEETASGLRSQWHHREINHQIQESRIRSINTSTAATPSPSASSFVPSSTSSPDFGARVTTATPSSTVHVLASDIRALLRAEQQKQIRQQQQQQKVLQNQLQPNPNLLRLQHNIDEWTEQEYSSGNGGDSYNVIHAEEAHNKPTTAAGTLAPSKNIPREYFSTPAFATSIPTNAPNWDHEPAASINHAIQTQAKTGRNRFKVKVDEKKVTTAPVFRVSDPKVFKISESTKGQTEPVTTTTLEDTTLTTTDVPITTTPEPRRTTWEKALLGYSPTTNEKVYVVTPMSTHEWTGSSVSTTTTPVPTSTTVSTSTTSYKKHFFIRGRGGKQQVTEVPAIVTSVDASSFRSPRFTVRPTPYPRSTTSPTVEEGGPSTPNSRGNRYYTVPTPDDFRLTTERVAVAERRSSPALTRHDVTKEPVNNLTSTTPPPSHHSATKHSKVVTVVTSSTSSSVPAAAPSSKKATGLTIKTVSKTSSSSVHIPVVAVSPVAVPSFQPPIAPPVAPQVAPDEAGAEEVAAAVREVSAVEIRRNKSSSA